MDSDKVTTVGGVVTTVSGLGGLAGMIDPQLLAVLPPPYNMYAILGMFLIAGLSHLITTYMTNKRQVTSTSDSKLTTM